MCIFTTFLHFWCCHRPHLFLVNYRSALSRHIAVIYAKCNHERNILTFDREYSENIYASIYILQWVGIPENLQSPCRSFSTSATESWRTLKSEMWSKCRGNTRHLQFVKGSDAAAATAATVRWFHATSRPQAKRLIPLSPTRRKSHKERQRWKSSEWNTRHMTWTLGLVLWNGIRKT